MTSNDKAQKSLPDDVPPVVHVIDQDSAARAIYYGEMSTTRVHYATWAELSEDEKDVYRSKVLRTVLG